MPVFHRPLFVAPSSGSSIALLAHTQAAGSQNGASTGAIDTTGANLLIAAVASYELSAAPAVTDSKGNTWTQLTSYTSGGASDTRVTLYYAIVVSVGGGHTFSASGSSIYANIAVAAFSGAHASPFDTENGASGSGASIQPGSITPSANGSLLFTALTENQAGTASIDSSFTILDQGGYSAGVSFGIAAAYLIQGSAAAVNPTWSQSSGSFSASIASFKSA